MIVFQDIIGLVYFLEFFLGLRVVLVLVRVELHREFAERFFDFIGAGSFFDPEGFIKIFC